MYLGDYYDAIIEESGLTKEAEASAAEEQVEQVKVAEVIEEMKTAGVTFETEEDANAAAAFLAEVKPIGPMPKVGDVVWVSSIYGGSSFKCNPVVEEGHDSALVYWRIGLLCVEGYQAELEASFNRRKEAMLG